jgi:HAD superfamily hydrolase (TIGR01509 family)
MIRHIIFDFFGVLHEDPLKTWINTYQITQQSAVAAVAYKLDSGQIDYHEYISQLALLSGQTLQQVQAAMLLPDGLNLQTRALIKSLRANFQVALLSNAVSSEIQPILEQHQLHELFDHIVISSETGLAKPDPAIFTHTLELMEAQPEETLFIDDSLTNLAGARMAGLRTVHFTSCKQAVTDMRQHLPSLVQVGA